MSGDGAAGVLAEAVLTSAELPSPPLRGRAGEGGTAPTLEVGSAPMPKPLASRALLRSATPLPTLPRKGGGVRTVAPEGTPLLTSAAEPSPPCGGELATEARR